MTNRLARAFGVGAMLVGLMAGFVLWWASVIQTQKVRDATPALVATATPIGSAAAQALAGMLRRAIIAQPLDQDLVDRFYTLASVNRLINAPTLDRWRSQLSRLGWRSTPAQQNLLASAAASLDLHALLDRTDGMIRRQQLVSQLIVLLYIIEQAPETHPALLDRLERHVPWRATFFADPRGVITPEGRRARFDTIRSMLDHGYPVSRAEVAPLLIAMVSAGEQASAYGMWRTFRSQHGQGNLPGTGRSFDPDFVTYADAQHQAPSVDLPFEWQTLSGNGFSADVGRDGITLHWDGSGVPVLLRQTFHAIPGSYELAMSGADATPEFFNRFEVAATCPQGDTLFTLLRRGTDGSFLVGSDRSVPCDFPVLSIRGRASLVSQPVDASLAMIALHPSHG